MKCIFKCVAELFIFPVLKIKERREGKKLKKNKTKQKNNNVFLAVAF